MFCPSHDNIHTNCITLVLNFGMLELFLSLRLAAEGEGNAKYKQFFVALYNLVL